MNRGRETAPPEPRQRTERMAGTGNLGCGGPPGRRAGSGWLIRTCPPVACPPVACPPVARPPVARPPVARPPMTRPGVAGHPGTGLSRWRRYPLRWTRPLAWMILCLKSLMCGRSQARPGRRRRGAGLTGWTDRRVVAGRVGSGGLGVLVVGTDGWVVARPGGREQRLGGDLRPALRTRASTEESD
jgi:hypothetical protein